MHQTFPRFRQHPFAMVLSSTESQPSMPQELFLFVRHIGGAAIRHLLRGVVDALCAFPAAETIVLCTRQEDWTTALSQALR